MTGLAPGNVAPESDSPSTAVRGAAAGASAPGDISRLEELVDGKILRIENNVISAKGRGTDILSRLFSLRTRDVELSAQASSLTSAMLKRALWYGLVVPFIAVLPAVLFPLFAILSVPVVFVSLIVAFITLARGLSAVNGIRGRMLGLFTPSAGRDHHKANTLIELLEVLKDDGGGKRPFVIRCDCRPSILKEFRKGHVYNRGGLFSYSSERNKYRHKWFDARVHLADGNSVRFRVIAAVDEKIKYKKRTKFRRHHSQTVQVDLTVSPSSFAGVRPAEALAGDCIESFVVKSLRQEGNEISIELEGLGVQVVPAAILLKTLSALYSHLIPLDRKQLRKRRSNPGS